MSNKHLVEVGQLSDRITDLEAEVELWKRSAVGAWHLYNREALTAGELIHAESERDEAQAQLREANAAVAAVRKWRDQAPDKRFFGDLNYILADSAAAKDIQSAAEREPELAAKYDKLSRTLEFMVAREAKMRKALEPLARLAEDSPSSTPDDHCLYDGAFEGLSLGDARRARAVLEMEAK